MSDRDPYDVLGLLPGASADDVRSAYRGLALKTHPDRCPGDPTAKDRFHEVKKAYDVLSDPVRRAQVDARRFAGADLTAEIDVPFAASLHGGPVELELLFPRNGLRVVVVHLPPGVQVGWTRRFAGQGVAGTPPGDLIVRVRRILDDPEWRVEGLDLRRRLEVSLADVVEGATIEVRAPSGTHRVKLRQGSLEVHREPRKGLRRGNRVGDLVLELVVRWPRPTPALLRELRAAG